MVLAEAQREAIKLLLSLPAEHPRAELSVARIEDQSLWLGLGWLIGKGWAIYCGGYCFRFAEGGKESAKKWLEE